MLISDWSSDVSSSDLHALAGLRAQLAVGAFQLARPRLEAELELGVRGLEVLLRALARQCAVDVVGDEGEQLLVARSEADLRRVALHHDPADHRVVALERHAQPAARQRTETAHGAGSLQLGRAAGRERACQYVQRVVVAVTLYKQHTQHKHHY